MNALMESLRARWQAYSTREKIVWAGLAAALLVVLLWLYVWQPLADRRAQAQAELAQAEQALAYLQRAAPQLRVQNLAGDDGASPVQSMTNLISRTAAQQSVDLTRFEQSGNDGLRLWLDNQPFDRVLLWLADLESQGLTVDQLTLSQGNSTGQVNLRGVVVRY
ncbi:type II secretion system protein M [Natronospirillum operosum]|uniref:Type II secretion system protein M n=1 Tax=Natronospirillum operosum TaxID=2759953 RepID=A0A4Z0WJF6_9GAMM|nr:type II secretion system protein GspM [Natronospirillum operosum]TGG95641.1 type II secretion system protein M [Natronospirillum operosum]